MGLSFIFDCDGTLLDTIAAWHKAEFSLLEKAGHKLTKEQSDHINSLPLNEACAYFHTQLGILESPEQVRAQVMSNLLSYYENKAEAKNGVLSFLSSLKAAGRPMSVLSSSPQEFLHAGLKRTSLHEYFQLIVSVEDIEGSKQDAQTYLDLCRSMGSLPGETWFFDDSWYALCAAQSAGLNTIGIYSDDLCGMREELGKYSVRVFDDFSSLSLELCEDMQKELRVY